MKAVYIAYIVILSIKPHSGDVMVYDVVDKQTKSFHITVYSNMGYKKGDIIEHGFIHLISDSLNIKSDPYLPNQMNKPTKW
jgi:hypothetical protein